MDTRLTDTALPRISLSLISLIRSSTLIASGRSFLFAKTSNGTVARAGRARRAWSSEVAVGRDLGCRLSVYSPINRQHRYADTGLGG